MNILMATNTYTPHVGGVARSVAAFTAEYRRLGHRVVVVAPAYDASAGRERDIIRVPALQRFNGSDFALALPIPGFLSAALAGFRPDIVHSHHPFLLGDTARRLAAVHRAPLVFTNHTLYDRYTHYVPGNSPAMRRFVRELWTGYADLCDAVLAPSASVAAMLRGRGITAPIEVLSTGIDLEPFRRGDRGRGRAALGLPPGAFVVGHVGRLTREKNLDFLARSVAAFLKKRPSAWFLVVGSGPMAGVIRKRLAGGPGGPDRAIRQGSVTEPSGEGMPPPRAWGRPASDGLGAAASGPGGPASGPGGPASGPGERLRLTGALAGSALTDAYSAMDAFAFSSKTETQGMVLLEAMAAGVPVAALDASGSRDIVRDEVNGRLVAREDPREFAQALTWLSRLGSARRAEVRAGALETAAELSITACARRALGVYQGLLRTGRRPRRADGLWAEARRTIAAEVSMVGRFAAAAAAAVAR